MMDFHDLRASESCLCPMCPCEFILYAPREEYVCVYCKINQHWVHVSDYIDPGIAALTCDDCGRTDGTHNMEAEH